MPAHCLTRAALARVLRSLLLAEVRAARGRGGTPFDVPPHLQGAWPDDLPFGAEGLGCDSLEKLWLAAAVNEMFHLHEAGREADLLGLGRFGDWLDEIEAAWRTGVGRITFSTSGTSGQPKRCSQTFAHLRTETDALAARWADRRRVVALVPAHHIYGFMFTALLPDRLGVAVLDAASLGPGRLADERRAGDLLVSFPDRWAWIERSLPDWPADVEGVVSTAPCPRHLVDALLDRGLSRMTDVYGSSETAGIAFRDAPAEPYRLMPQWRFAEPFDADAPDLVHGSGLRFAMMDRIERHGIDGFRLVGRRDGMVQVGGVNVSPEAVALALRARPGVRDAVVRLMRPGEGTRLKAFVVPDAGVAPSELLAALDQWIAIHLPTGQQPRSIVLGAVLPTGLLGNSADW